MIYSTKENIMRPGFLGNLDDTWFGNLGQDLTSEVVRDPRADTATYTATVGTPRGRGFIPPSPRPGPRFPMGPNHPPIYIGPPSQFQLPPLQLPNLPPQAKQKAKDKLQKMQQQIRKQQKYQKQQLRQLKQKAQPAKQPPGRSKGRKRGWQRGHKKGWFR